MFEHIMKTQRNFSDKSGISFNKSKGKKMKKQEQKAISFRVLQMP
jgi:hypothetical protein